MERYVYSTWVQINMRRRKFRVNLTNDVMFSSLKERRKNPPCFWCYFIFIGRDPKWSQLSCECSGRLRSSLIASECLSPLAHTFLYMNTACSSSGCLLSSALTLPREGSHVSRTTGAVATFAWGDVRAASCLLWKDHFLSLLENSWLTGASHISFSEL